MFKLRLKQELLLRKYKKNYRLITILLVVIIVCIIGYFMSISPKPDPVPKSIQNRVSFTIFYPVPSQQTVFKQDSFKYNKSLSQITFVVNFDKRNITFAEQSTPGSFNSSPSFYQSFVQKLGGYATFDAVNGRVDLTLPIQTEEQTAIMNAKGTLLFANSSGKISENNWKLLFNSVNNIQPK